MIVRHMIRENTYYDSVILMLISREIKKMEGVVEALVGMGTDLNKELAVSLNLSSPWIRNLKSNDFFIAVALDGEERMTSVVRKVDEILAGKKLVEGDDYHPATLEGALKYQPDTNLVIVSVPGKYAAEEVRKALANDLHVMLFSDHVAIEDERALKALAVEKGLLMMGPDCGTAIINHVPLAFANVIRKGSIGVVGASGTGIQEVTTLIDRIGGGVSQVIGTGGRDLKAEIGGLMMVHGMKALMNDPSTEVIVLISKPPAPEVAEAVLTLAGETEKPVVVAFIGGDREQIRRAGVYPCLTLEDAAYKADALEKGEGTEDFKGFTMTEGEAEAIVQREVALLDGEQKYVRGCFTGGTLAYEALKILDGAIGSVYSNLAYDGEHLLKASDKSIEHTCIDMGDDQFTVGRPHPMIDPGIRNERILEDVDGEVAVLLADVVLGYGAHPDPAGELAVFIKKVKEKMSRIGKYVSIICTLCGTEGDPQNLKASREVLQDAGAIVMPSNAQAVRLAVRILKAIGQTGGGREKINITGEVNGTNVETNMTNEVGDRQATIEKSEMYETIEVNKVDVLFSETLKIVNIGLETFYADLKRQEIQVVQVAWRPPAGGDEKMASLLSRLK